MEKNNNIWIVKANALSRGRGIYLVNDPAQISLESPCIVSKYISNPLLIKEHKFDLRLYVLVTSFDPLRVYLYKEGLARFGSEKYNIDKSLKNKFMHLTNYSINKKNTKFVKNQDENADDYGSKWSLTALLKHLGTLGGDTDKLWKRIIDIIIKSIIAGEKHISSAVKRNLEHRGNGFELFGFDVLIDNDFKPWVMEINLSPSLAGEAPIDLKIKAKLIADSFNLVGLKQFDRKEEARKKIKSRTRAGLNHLTKGPQFSKLSTQCQVFKAPIEIFGSGFLNKEDIQRQNSTYEKGILDKDIKDIIKEVSLNGKTLNEQEIHDLFKRITYKKKEILKDTLLESQRTGGFNRIFPTKDTDKYFRYFFSQNNGNQAVYDFLFSSQKIEDAKDNSSKTDRNFCEPKYENSLFVNTNKHFRDLEARLRPLKHRPDSAANPIRYKGLSINESNLSTRSSTKPNESIVRSKNKNKTTEDILIDYYQGIIDNIKNQFMFFSDKNATVINFEYLEEIRPYKQPLVSMLHQNNS